MNKKVIIIAVGGTFDKVYYDALSDYRIGEPQIDWILKQAKLDIAYEIQSLIKKDSLDMDTSDRLAIHQAIVSSSYQHFLITHGTDTMVATAQALQAIEHKTIVLTGAMQPARFRDSDACFNAGFALAASLLLPAGVYIAMHGKVFEPDSVRKNRSQGRFEPKP